MFLKIVRSAQNIDYVYVVEGYRDDIGRIRHKYLFSLGRLDDFLNTESFKKLAKRALTEGKECFDFTKISEGRVLNYGHCLIKKLWDKFQFNLFSFLFIYEGLRDFIKQRCINRKNKRSFKEHNTDRV